MKQMQEWYNNKETEPSSSAEFWELCERRQQYRKVYHDYWESTCKKSVSQRMVDGVIMPVGPSAAAEVGTFEYYGKTAPPSNPSWRRC